jgi:hypothetical protein
VSTITLINLIGGILTNASTHLNQLQPMTFTNKNIKSYGKSLDWTVSAIPTVIEIDGQQYQNENHTAILRSDIPYPQSLLGYVSGGYEIVQNSRLLEILEPLVNEGIGTITNSGYLQSGKKVFVQLQLNEGFEFNGLEHKQFLTILNTHNGSSSLMIGTGNIRVICSNTFTTATKSLETKLAHREGINTLLSIDSALRYINLESSKYLENITKLDRLKISDKQLKPLIVSVFGDSDKIYNNIVQLFRSGLGNSGKTGLDLFSACTDYVSHKQSDEVKKIINPLIGIGADKSSKMMSNLLQLV